MDRPCTITCLEKKYAIQRIILAKLSTRFCVKVPSAPHFTPDFPPKDAHSHSKGTQPSCYLHHAGPSFWGDRHQGLDDRVDLCTTGHLLPLMAAHWIGPKFTISTHKTGLKWFRSQSQHEGHIILTCGPRSDYMSVQVHHHVTLYLWMSVK